jgi:tubulin epsilon
MPRELVTIQVGQCGNQIGCRFWELALREHAAHNRSGVYDEALSSFFRNVDTAVTPHRSLPVGSGQDPIRTLKVNAKSYNTEPVDVLKWLLPRSCVSYTHASQL